MAREEPCRDRDRSALHRPRSPNCIGVSAASRNANRGRLNSIEVLEGLAVELLAERLTTINLSHAGCASNPFTGACSARWTLAAHRSPQSSDTILEAATAGSPGALLDIGCGEGTFLEAAARRGYRVTGTERGAAAEHASTQLEVCASLEEARERAPFDVVTLWHTLEHFRSPRETLTMARSLLRPGGLVIAAVPNASGLQARVFGSRWFHLDVPRHLFHFNPRSLERLLVETGLDVQRWYHQELEYDWFGWIQSALNATFFQPNTLFQSMSGKPVDSAAGSLAVHYALAAAIAPAALAATALGTVTGRGGTVIAVARS